MDPGRKIEKRKNIVKANAREKSEANSDHQW